MNWEQLTASKKREILTHLVTLLDHTLLNFRLGINSILSELKNIFTELEKYNLPLPASVCVHPCMAQSISKIVPVPVCSVIGFPEGMDTIDAKLAQISYLARMGAIQEVDFVPAWAFFYENQSPYPFNEIKLAKNITDSMPLKVIMETSIWYEHNPHLLQKACINTLHAGANFLKTCTGRYGSATPEAVRLLATILAKHKKHGIKISGGISTVEKALQLLNVITTTWNCKLEDLTPHNCRIGSSKLIYDILQKAKYLNEPN